MLFQAVAVGRMKDPTFAAVIFELGSFVSYSESTTRFSLQNMEFLPNSGIQQYMW